jgi:ribosomal protein L37AE/L43A
MRPEPLDTKTVYPVMARNPVCVRCGGTGYVYLWSFERLGARVWFCDRCKRSWSDAGALP